MTRLETTWKIQNPIFPHRLVYGCPNQRRFEWNVVQMERRVVGDPHSYKCIHCSTSSYIHAYVGSIQISRRSNKEIKVNNGVERRRKNAWNWLWFIATYIRVSWCSTWKHDRLLIIRSSLGGRRYNGTNHFWRRNARSQPATHTKKRICAFNRDESKF
jgi:hypothetical protein